MLNIFILEDFKDRIDWFNKTFSDHNVYTTKNISDACDKVANNQFDLIFFDRDLGNPNENGEDLAWFMLENKLAKDTPVIIHSENDRGQRVIARYLNKYKKNVFSMKFYNLKKHSFEDIVKFAKIDSYVKTGNNSPQIQKEDQSFIDFLINNPSIMGHARVEKTGKAKAIESLYTIWKNDKNKINNNIFQKPESISFDDFEGIEKQGLISIVARGRFKITTEGSKMLKIMILGDNRCALEKNNDNKLDYRTAQANIKKSKKSLDWINKILK